MSGRGPERSPAAAVRTWFRTPRPTGYLQPVSEKHTLPLSSTVQGPGARVGQTAAEVRRPSWDYAAP